MTIAGRILHKIREDIWATVSADDRMTGNTSLDTGQGITTTTTGGMGYHARGPVLNEPGKDIWDLTLMPDDPEDVGRGTTMTNDRLRPITQVGDVGQAVTANVGRAHAGPPGGLPGGLPESYLLEDRDDDDDDEEDGDGEDDGEDDDDNNGRRKNGRRNNNNNDNESYLLGLRIGESDDALFNETIQEVPAADGSTAVVNVSDTNKLSIICGGNTYVCDQDFANGDEASSWFASNVTVPIDCDKLGSSFKLLNSANPDPVDDTGVATT